MGIFFISMNEEMMLEYFPSPLGSFFMSTMNEEMTLEYFPSPLGIFFISIAKLTTFTKAD